MILLNLNILVLFLLNILLLLFLKINILISKFLKLSYILMWNYIRMKGTDKLNLAVIHCKSNLIQFFLNHEQAHLI